VQQEFDLKLSPRAKLAKSNNIDCCKNLEGKFVTATLLLKKIALVKVSNEPGSEPLLACKRAAWVQKARLLVQATLLRAALRSFHKGLHKCFDKGYELLFDVPYSARTDNDASGLSPIYIPAAG